MRIRLPVARLFAVALFAALCAIVAGWALQLLAPRAPIAPGGGVAQAQSGLDAALAAGHLAGLSAGLGFSALVDPTTGALANSAILSFSYTPGLAAAETLSLTMSILHDDETGGSYTSTVAILPKTVIKTGASTAADVYSINVDLSGYKRFLKIETTPDLGASGTDTVPHDGWRLVTARA